MNPPRKRRVILLGSTGSIGRSALKVAAHLPERIEMVALAAHGNAALLAEQARETGARHVAIFDESKVAELRSALPAGVTVHVGSEGLVELCRAVEADIALVAIVGTAGLQPALEAIRTGKELAIASKEILVMAGEIVTGEARRHGVKLLPVDSEHNAIFQCLDGHKGGAEDVSRLILTASGGPFRKTPASELATVDVRQA
ncbi:MAG TPA: 1-deoxy-D-xylulose-5-phosphate reductoisomerase, partial [Luteolibacter sp.]|nr:1-deoxy-D-xylulose-5-phosphate reductoisomerase [Luteolibacter sp.]